MTGFFPTSHIYKYILKTLSLLRVPSSFTLLLRSLPLCNATNHSLQYRSPAATASLRKLLHIREGSLFLERFGFCVQQLPQSMILFAFILTGKEGGKGVVRSAKLLAMKMI
ncbi:hypothetical protein P8452_01711 [Trifolium repens]|nr:hypothetical protein P8452_01711 [Trifolium repens]